MLIFGKPLQFLFLNYQTKSNASLNFIFINKFNASFINLCFLINIKQKENLQVQLITNLIYNVIKSFICRLKLYKKFKKKMV